MPVSSIADGKTGRYVLRTNAVRHARLDPDSDYALRWVQERLTETAMERATASMIFRRAINLYRSHIAGLPANSLVSEWKAVRRLTQRPGPRRGRGRRKTLHGNA